MDVLFYISGHFVHQRLLYHSQEKYFLVCFWWLLTRFVLNCDFSFDPCSLVLKTSKVVHCTMCTLFHTNSAGLLKLGHILKNPKKYFNEHIFFPALTTRRKMESFKFLWFSNSKKWKICDFRVIFPDFECSKNNVSRAGKWKQTFFKVFILKEHRIKTLKNYFCPWESDFWTSFF